MSSFVFIFTVIFLNLKAALALSLFALLISLSFCLSLIERKMRQGIIEITSSNKDRDLSFDHYEEEIESFFFLLRYVKKGDSFFPQGLSQVMSNEVRIKRDGLILEITGPQNILEILCETLKTPKSSFECHLFDFNLQKNRQ